MGERDNIQIVKKVCRKKTLTCSYIGRIDGAEVGEKRYFNRFQTHRYNYANH